MRREDVRFVDNNEAGVPEVFWRVDHGGEEQFDKVLALLMGQFVEIDDG